MCGDMTTGGTNAYTLTLVKIVGANPADEDAATLLAGETHPASFTAGDIDVFRFAGTAGEGRILVLDPMKSTGPFPSFHLHDRNPGTNGYYSFSSTTHWQQH